MQLTKFFCSLFALSFISGVAIESRAGSFTGNGADETELTLGSAWFQSSAPVDWCVHDDRNGEVARAVTEAFQTWNDYVVLKAVDENLPAGIRPFQSRFFFNASCNGEEPLQFVVSKTAAAKRNDKFNSHLAYAQRTSIGTDSRNSFGYVWINEKMLGTRYLKVLVLQQIGKIYGNGPIRGTIMEKKLIENWVRNDREPTYRIDFTRELFHSPTRPLRFFKALTRLEQIEFAKVFAPADTALTVDVELQPIAGGWRGAIALSDGRETWLGTIVANKELFATPTSEEVAFKRVVDETVYAYEVVSLSLAGYVQFESQPKRQAIMSLNANAALDIETLVKGRSSRLLRFDRHAPLR